MKKQGKMKDVFILFGACLSCVVVCRPYYVTIFHTLHETMRPRKVEKTVWGLEGWHGNGNCATLRLSKDGVEVTKSRPAALLRLGLMYYAKYHDTNVYQT